MVDLSVVFAGIRFRNPFTIAASPASDSGERVARAFEAGWGGAVLKTTSVEREPVNLAYPMMAGIGPDGRHKEAFFNIDLISERHIEIIERDIRDLKRDFPDRIVIGSIMASSREDWEELTIRLNEAGADMIECSMSCPQGEGGSIPVADPDLTREVTAWIKAASPRAPIIVKLTPNVTDIVAVARAAEEGGADAICAIDTVKALAGIDLDTFAPRPSVRGKSTWGGLSGPAIKPIALGCVAEISRSTRIPIAGVGGISTWREAAEFILVGAGTVQICTAAMQYGLRIIEDLTEGLALYLESKGMENLEELRGRTLPNLVEHDDLPRGFKVLSRIDHGLCLRDNLCLVACRDGGYDAITMSAERLPLVDEGKCRGCGLCVSVCPVMNCIRLEVAGAA